MTRSRSDGGTSEYLLIVAVIVILTLGGLTVFGEDLQRLLSPGGATGETAPTIYEAPAGPGAPAAAP